MQEYHSREKDRDIAAKLHLDSLNAQRKFNTFAREIPQAPSKPDPALMDMLDGARLRAVGSDLFLHQMKAEQADLSPSADGNRVNSAAFQ